MSTPSQPASPPSTINDNDKNDNATTTTTSNTSIYEYIKNYAFPSDAEFRAGLGTILGHPGTSASDAELLSGNDVVLQAKCFYISRKRNISPAIDFVAYKKWLAEDADDSTKTAEQQLTPASTSLTDSSMNIAAASSAAAGNDEQQSPKVETQTQPAYPSSFAHIVELITNNQPIPGIEEIPDTVLSGKDEPSKAARRRKPWEKDDQVVPADV